MKWDIVESGKALPDKNMLEDQILFDKLETLSNPLLRFYDWEGNCATYGYFIDPLRLLSEKGMKRQGLNIARRPTGGGVIFHMADLAFSMLIPSSHVNVSLNPIDNYAFVNQIVIDVLSLFLNQDLTPRLLPQEPSSKDQISKHFCMAKPTKYDVMISNRKVGGGAQRRSKFGILHQGSLSIAKMADEFLEDVLISSASVLQEMNSHSYFLISSQASQSEITQVRSEIKSLFQKVLI